MENRVKELREEMGLTQEHFGALANVSRQTIISIEKGVYNPSLELAMQISYIFGMPMGEIFISNHDWRVGEIERKRRDGKITWEEADKQIVEIFKNRGKKKWAERE